MNNIKFLDEVVTHSLDDLVARVSQQVTARLELLSPDRRIAVSDAHVGGENGDQVIVDILEIGAEDEPPATAGYDWTIYLPPARLSFTYTNHAGDTAQRTVINPTIYHGSTDYHPEPQWLLRAYDVDKRGERIFAIANARDFATTH